MPWACVQSKPGETEKAAFWAQQFGYKAWLPRCREGDGRVRPLFPRYFFAWIEAGWWSLRWAPGVSRVLTDGDGQLETVPEKEIQALRRREIDGVIRLPRRARWRRGDVLHTRDPWHVLAGRELVFEGMNDGDRVRVLLTWFGQPQSVELDAGLVG